MKNAFVKRSNACAFKEPFIFSCDLCFLGMKTTHELKSEEQRYINVYHTVLSLRKKARELGHDRHAHSKQKLDIVFCIRSKSCGMRDPFVGSVYGRALQIDIRMT